MGTTIGWIQSEKSVRQLKGKGKAIVLENAFRYNIWKRERDFNAKKIRKLLLSYPENSNYQCKWFYYENNKDSYSMSRRV